jgi:phosphoglycolate phosphatase
MRISAVVFDLDGTLLDTLEDIASCANRVLVDHGVPAFSLDAYKMFVGEGLRNLFLRALPAATCSEEKIRECSAQFRAEYDRGWDVITQPYDDVDQLLQEVAGRGYKMSVLSNKPHEFTVRCVERYFGSHPFDLVLGQSDDVPAKPDPAGARRIAEHLGLSPKECLFLGDTGTDMRTAVSAGMYPVGALWGFRSLEEVVGAGAEHVIAAPLELLSILDDVNRRQGG